MKELTQVTFNEAWRRQKSRAFSLFENSTAKDVVAFNLWGKSIKVYANANLSIYSAQRCNAACRFCVEELRPLSRGTRLEEQKTVEQEEGRYFAALEQTLASLGPLRPTLSITGGEASKDPRLPRILRVLHQTPSPRKTLTTNGSGLMDLREGKRVIEHVLEACIDHLNISVAHPDSCRNAELMRLREGLTPAQFREAVHLANAAGTRVRLSCVLLDEGIRTLHDVTDYLEFAAQAGVDNVILRQLMKSDPRTHAANSVVAYSDAQRVCLERLLDEISADARFEFVRQVMGYYYYVEVWRYRARIGSNYMDVVFEEADLAHLEDVKRRNPETIHELVFHPNAKLASTWQPWDGVLGPDERMGGN